MNSSRGCGRDGKGGDLRKLHDENVSKVGID
jgi:hypothetical protein